MVVFLSLEELDLHGLASDILLELLGPRAHGLEFLLQPAHGLLVFRLEIQDLMAMRLMQTLQLLARDAWLHRDTVVPVPTRRHGWGWWVRGGSLRKIALDLELSKARRELGLLVLEGSPLGVERGP